MANHTSSAGRLVALAVALGTAGGAAADFKPLDGQQYREFFDPPNPVKGEALVGISIVPNQKAQEGDEVQVWFSGRYAGKLSVETLAADGSFRGIGSFEGSSEDEWTPLPIRPDTKTPGKTRPADPETLALAVRGEDPDEFVIAHWGDKPEAQNDLVVRFYVNGRRGDMRVSAGDATVRCKPVDLPRPLRFDAICDLPFAAVLATYSIVLTRSDGFGSDQQTITILH